MPTAGEARLKSKSLKKTSKDGASLKGKATSIKPSTSKVREAKRKTVSHATLNSGKSSIPVLQKKGAKGKENTDPKVDPLTQINNKSSKVKQAPDFRKLHRKWEDQLSKGKAVSKKKNTTVEPFKLAENNKPSQKFKRPYAYNSEEEEENVSDDDDFEIDSTALKGILSDTGIKDEDLRVTGRATIAAIPSRPELAIQPAEGILKRTSIYYTGPPPQHTAGASSSVSKLWRTPSTTQPAVSPLTPRNVDVVPACRSQAVSCTKKQVAWADEVSEKDAFDFQPDSQALQSILSNTGITFNQMSVQNTGRVTLAGGRLTPYRKTRQSFREEPSKRTSIYYTGPRRTRPSPRACGMGRASVMGARQLTADPTINSKKPSVFDPLATMVGRQGNQEIESDPVVSLGARQFATGQPAPGFQTASNNFLLTPARELVSSTQLSSARDQPSWAEIFTPQRGATVQDSAVQAARTQLSIEPLRTPAKQQFIQEDICTPQRITGVQNAGITQGTTFANPSSTSKRQPLVEFKQHRSAADSFTPQNLFSNPNSSTRQHLTVDFQRRHDAMATPARQPPTGFHVPSSELPPDYSHVLAASFQPPERTLTTPVRQGQLVAQSFSSDQPPLWTEIFTPQRGLTTSAMTAHSSNDPLVTPMRQCLPVTQGSCSTYQPSVANMFAPPQSGDAIQDLGPRLRCSTVHITSFQLSTDTTQGSCSTEDFLTPQHIESVRKDYFKLTPVEEEDDIARLERQALEDLGLLKITEGTQKSPAASCTKIQDNSDVMRSLTFDTWTDQSKTATTEQTNLRSVSPDRSADGSFDPNRSSCNATATRTNQHSSFEKYSSFSPAVRFATPTPVKESRVNLRSTLHTSSFTRGGRELATSKDVPAIPFNSTPLFSHQDLAPRVDENTTYSGLSKNSSFIKYSQINQTTCVAPSPVRLSHRSASRTTCGEPSAASVSSASSVNRAESSEETLSEERDVRPVQVVSPTPKVQHYKSSNNKSLSLRSAVLSSNPGDLLRRTRTEDSTAFSGDVNTRFRWEPNVPEAIPSAFRPTAPASRRIPKTLAQEALLDLEVSVYMTADHGRVVTPRDWNHRPMNPLAKVFAEGDSMHFLPINIHHSL
ncbi:uncharacterized protein LOC144661687 isoform X2 [Oculina patagonica]